MAKLAMQYLKSCYSKRITHSKTATEEKIFIYYPDMHSGSRIYRSPSCKVLKCLAWILEYLRSLKLA